MFSHSKTSGFYRYTEHSTVGLAQQWDQLNQLGMRIRHNLEQQIQARNQSGVTEDQLKEFSMMFRHFDKDKSGKKMNQSLLFWANSIRVISKVCLVTMSFDQRCFVPTDWFQILLSILKRHDLITKLVQVIYG